MRDPSHKENNRRLKKFIFLLTSVLILVLYLVYSYNNLKGRNYIYEPVYISIEGRIPETTRLELSYQTFSDPTIYQKVLPQVPKNQPATTHTFKIDSTYRLKNFSIYFRSFREGEEITISSIKASNLSGDTHHFSLEVKDLIPSKNVHVDQTDHGGIRLEKLPFAKSNVSFLNFYGRNLNKDILVRTGVRKNVLPSIPALLFIIFLFFGLLYCLFPVLNRLNWNGISLGTYLLALSILILPSGEKASNLILALSLMAGLVKIIREKSMRKWIHENLRFLLMILAIISIYLIAFLFNSSDPSTIKLLKIKFGLPMILLAIAINSNYKREIQILFTALLSGALISVIMHFGWAIMLIETVEIKSRIFSNMRYFMESAVYSRIHHSYLSVLYLASLAAILLKRDIIDLRKSEIIVFSLLLLSGLFFAFSRAAILALILILIFMSMKYLFSLLKIEINHPGRFLAASALSIGLLLLVFADLKINSASENLAIKGLTTRMDIWEKSGELIKQKPIFGWGPGNYKYALIESNSAASFNTNRWEVLNTHNQFLETAGMFGLPLALVLIWFLLFPTGFARKLNRHSDFIIGTAIIIATTFFFESLLNRNLGVLVFGLIYSILIKIDTIYDR